jgi:hypothetical protein
MEQRECVCCRTRFTPSRNPRQRYCSKSVCQKKRRCRYQKQKVKHDSDYRENQRSSERDWHKRHPHYWRHYRKGHPQQVATNRLAQQVRDKKRRRKEAIFYNGPMLATMYSFTKDKHYLSSSYNVFLCNISLLATIGRYVQATNALLT